MVADGAGRRQDLLSGGSMGGYGMRRRFAVCSILAGTLLAISGLGSAALAQDADQMPTADSPVVGAWELTVDGDAPGNAPTEMVFHADGTYIQAVPGMTGIGSWVATGPNTGALTFIQYGVDEAGAVGRDMIRATMEVSEDGQSMTAAFTMEITMADGVSTGQMGPGTGTATRIEVEPMTPAEPAASTAP